MLTTKNINNQSSINNFGNDVSINGNLIMHFFVDDLVQLLNHLKNLKKWVAFAVVLAVFIVPVQSDLFNVLVVVPSVKVIVSFTNKLPFTVVVELSSKPNTAFVTAF